MSHILINFKEKPKCVFYILWESIKIMMTQQTDKLYWLMFHLQVCLVLLKNIPAWIFSAMSMQCRRARSIILLIGSMVVLSTFSCKLILTIATHVHFLRAKLVLLMIKKLLRIIHSRFTPEFFIYSNKKRFLADIIKYHMLRVLPK